MSSEHGRRLRGLPTIDENAQFLARTESTFGRFGRLFPDLPVAVYGADSQTTFPGSTTALVALAESMIKEDDLGTPFNEKEEEDENPTISSGYTYFGQFIDHDLTFDTASSLDKVNDPGALDDFRTARFDLDSLYGRGPDDQPYMYRAPDFCSLIVGENRAPPALPPRRDLPRNADQRAIIGDPRNDENKLVSQFQALFQAFHNIVVAQTPMGPERLLAAQQRVRFHYQWLVVHDFLKHILNAAVWDAYFGHGAPTLRFYKLDRGVYPFIPVEFAVAAYRFGHSMIRPSYSLNDPVLTDIAGAKPRIPIFAIDPEPRNHLNGFQALPDFWGIDWSFFFPGVQASTRPGQDTVQPSYRIDTLLVEPLKDLPDRQGLTPPWKKSLAARNLVRGRALGLPSGQRVAAALGLPALTDDQLWQDEGNLEEDEIIAKRRQVLADFPAFKQNAPLWYYILREAEILETDGGELGGHRLGPVGSTIVAETFAALLLHDPFSYFERSPGFRPDLDGVDPGAFDLAALINFVDRHQDLVEA